LHATKAHDGSHVRQEWRYGEKDTSLYIKLNQQSNTVVLSLKSFRDSSIFYLC
jgi:hypothetical protein